MRNLLRYHSVWGLGRKVVAAILQIVSTTAIRIDTKLTFVIVIASWSFVNVEMVNGTMGVWSCSVGLNEKAGA